MNEQKFDIAINKVKKLPVPLLVIGLGGTGKDAVIQCKKTFAERYELPKNEKGQELPAPEKTAYLVFDSVGAKPEELEVSEYVDISLSGLDSILKNQKALLEPSERSWVNPNLSAVSASLGMGTIRQAARLALSRNFDKVFTAIKSAVNNIVSVNAGTAGSKVNAVEIAVITGIGGGTGSGIFLDMAQIIRAAVNASTVIPPRLTGYIVMPDVSLARVKGASGMEMPIKKNAYAALKELDFWMRVKQHQVKYSMKYGSGTEIEWKEAPFNQCILMSSSNVEGIPYKDGYSAVMSTIAENLMHYMAEEDSTKEQYSYREYEDNLAAIGKTVPQYYPLYYGYRAIGAFTKRIPKKSILYYEGSLLLKTFVPLRDDSGKLQPDRRMFTDGQGKPRAENISGNGPQLMTDFRTNICRLPGFCNMDLRDNVKVTAVQNMNPPPHNKWHTWRDTVSSPAALDAADKYLEKAWSRFEEWATSIIMDPGQGPFALSAYLDSSEGLIADLEETLASWTNQYHKTRSQLIGQGEQMCNNAWPGFRNPPLLGKKGALEQYDHAIKSLYTYVNNCQFLEKYTAALEKLILRIKEYVRDGLKPLCSSIEFLEKEFNSQDNSDAVLVQDIYSLSTVQAGIDDKFKEENANDKLSSEFLRKIAEISMETEPNVDAKTSGVSFICRRVGLTEMCRVLQADMEQCYGDVNNQTLDDIMIANVGDDVAAQNKWMDDLAKGAIQSALPMFMQDSVFKDTPMAPYSYMSIPEKAEKHLKYISQAFSTGNERIEPKASKLDDHIYVLMAWDRLGLFRYGLFEELRSAYEQDVRTGYGLHLVRNGSEEDYLSDWSKLPSPKPYFLFPGSGIRSEQDAYKEVHDLVTRGIACGMIKVMENLPYAEAEISILYTGEAVTASATLDQQAEDIKQEINPATGAKYDEGEIRSRLKAMIDRARVTRLQETKVAPTNIASLMGMDGQPVDPGDPIIKADVRKLAIAEENYKKLCTAMTEAMIYTRPDLVRALRIQLPARERIEEEIRKGEVIKGIWAVRSGFAENAANIFLFLNDRIFQGGKEYKYKEKGNKYDIITPEIMREDIRQMESSILRASCFLADAPDENAAKADLARLLKKAMRDYEEAVENEEMTLEEMEDLNQAADDCLAELGEDITYAERITREDPSRTESMAPMIQMAGDMVKTLEGWKRTFRKIMRGLKRDME